MYVDSNTNNWKSFEIEKFLNKKRQVKKGRGRALEYLVRWKSYSPKWDRWYNIKELDNAAAFIDDYKASLAFARTHFLNKDVDFFSQ